MYGIPRVVIAENKNFVGAMVIGGLPSYCQDTDVHGFIAGGENLLLAPPSPPLSASYARSRILINANLKRAEEMMGDWIKSKEGGKVWWEDIGQVGETS